MVTVDEFRTAQARMLNRYSVDAESRYIDVAVIEGRAHVLVIGDGPPLVMIGGIGTPAAMWAPLMAQLTGFTIHAIDLPGFGLTDTTPGLTDDYRRTAVRFLTESLDQLGLNRPNFVANSLGSLWTIWLALDEPDQVKAMVHVGCPAVSLGTAAPIPMRMLSAPLLGRVMMKMSPPSPKQVKQLSKMVGEYPLVPELSDLLLATERLPGFEPTFLATLHKLLRLRGARPSTKLTAEQAGEVTQPTQLVWGRNDPMGSPEVGERMVEAMQEAELHVVDGGHTPWLTEAEVIGPLASAFLRKHA